MTPNPDEQYCYLTTTGRTSGQPREIEIWFGLIGSNLYMLSGSGAENGRPKAHWVRNLVKQPHVSVRIGGTTYQGVAGVVEPGTDEDRAARELVVSKYTSSSSSDLSNWGRTSVVVAVELRASPSPASEAKSGEGVGG
jgi:deazaflavin-dependent oxidoreductase (nitroreductase family)